MKWFLEYQDTDNQSQRLELAHDKPLKIGRGTSSDTRIPDPALSRVHCQVQVVSEGVELTDLESSSGTFVEEAQTASHVLTDGQTFRAGETVFRIASDSDLDAPTRMHSASDRISLEALQSLLDAEKKLDRFHSLKVVNVTGDNLVYKAVDGEYDKQVALKVLPTERASDEEESRFIRAIRTIQEIRDPSLIKMYRAGRKSDFCWVAMEWMEGGSLADRVSKLGIGGRLDWKDAWTIAGHLSKSLAVLEEAGIVHRNIKPTSLLFRQKENRWVLSDLVVAKAQGGRQTKMVTRQVFLPGNLAYTAPERLMGQELNEHSLQADIYSLGAVLTEILTGEPPFGRGGLMEILPRLQNPRRTIDGQEVIGMNDLCCDLVNRMTDPDPNRRYQSANELWQEFARVGKNSGLPVHE